ncbi:MAG: MotA/TolQ/ExbB proton channel family protein [Aquificae bacterium]|nr:MotA/TolQ/ExbB proton channel family protein [Aquificota bacterium]
MEFIVSVFQKGGPIMYPLLILGVLSIALIVERFYSLSLKRVIPTKVLEEIDFYIREKRFAEAFTIARSKNSLATEVIAAILNAYLSGRRKKEDLIAFAEEAAKIEIPKLETLVNALGAIAAIAPLLGFLGTVTGMIQVFEALSIEGLGNPDVLAKGISQALLTTAFGLTIAIPSIAAYWFFRNKVTFIVAQVENIAMNLVYELVSLEETQEEERNES